MPTVKLTHRGIEKLKPPGKWLTDYFDEGLPNFGVRVHQSGRRAFFVRYTADGKKRRLTIGTYPSLSLADARAKAKMALGRIARGEDPQAEKQADKDAETFAELTAEYLERHTKRKKKSWREDERILNVDLLPAWGRRKAKTITRREVVS